MTCKNCIGHDNCAGDDKGVPWHFAFMFQLRDGIEGKARWFAPKPRAEKTAQPANGKCKDLGNALNGKPRCRITSGNHATVGKTRRDA